MPDDVPSAAPEAARAGALVTVGEATTGAEGRYVARRARHHRTGHRHDPRAG
ncbi:hypothetical protein [Isoptericola haloaureus]|uniref:Uncharacterized protein n=1 Tax=Isoptericola haloaureus TaxID=1542902 RepID=A0ABU7ZAU2_9MICO